MNWQAVKIAFTVLFPLVILESVFNQEHTIEFYIWKKVYKNICVFFFIIVLRKKERRLEWNRLFCSSVTKILIPADFEMGNQDQVSESVL